MQNCNCDSGLIGSIPPALVGLRIARTPDGRIILSINGEAWPLTAGKAREVAATLNEFADASDLVLAQFAAEDAAELIPA